MSPSNGSFDHDALLSHVGWVRALARSLVPADVHLAEDVTQDAYLVAIENSPDSERPLGVWLATVVKNLVRRHHRAAIRREDRERLVARSEAQPPVSAHDDTLALHRELVEAVMELDEPYREAIVLRFFGELSPTAIARRQSIPVATVKTRLMRGLAHLRLRLDRNHGGDGRSWLLALIPFCKPSGGAAATTLGALLVSTKLKLAIAAVLVAFGVIAVLRSHDHAQPALASTSNAAAPIVAAKSPGNVPTVLATVDTTGDDRHAVTTSTAAEPGAVTPTAVLLMVLHGSVLDAEAHARSGLRVCYSPGRRDISGREFNVPPPKASADSPSAVTNDAGAFELSAPPGEGDLFVPDEHWTTVLSSMCGPTSSASEHVIVVAPRLEHAGRVVDEAGAPLATARIEIQLPRDLRLRFQHILDTSNERGWVTVSDEQGRFAFADAPSVDGSEMSASLAGYLGLVQPAPSASEKNLELVLHRPGGKSGMLVGQVLDERGRPVPEASVSLGHVALCTSDKDGQFELQMPEEGVRDTWIAVKPGHRPAIQPSSAAVKAGHVDPGEFVVLRLGPPPLTISGHVVDADDHPLDGMRVFLADPTFFGASDEVPLHVEGMLSGAAQRADIEKLMANAPAGSGPEEILHETSNAFWTFVRTDASGHFTIEGLLDREYHVSALDEKSLVRVDSEPMAAGTQDALIRLSRDAYLSNIHGQLVTSRGQPVPGVRVIPSTDVMTVRFDAESFATMDFTGPSVLTDGEGRFEFERLPREGAYLALRSEDILPLVWARGAAGGIEAAAHGKPDRIVIQVELRYHFQVEGAPELADELSVLDADGHNVQITFFEGAARTSTNVLPLVAGRSNVLVVSDAARTLVLFKTKQEVRRLPLDLVRSQMNLIRY